MPKNFDMASLPSFTSSEEVTSQEDQPTREKSSFDSDSDDDLLQQPLASSIPIKSTKQTSRMRAPLTPHPGPDQNKPQKIHQDSAIHIALQEQAEGRPQGLMRFLTKCTPEELSRRTKKVDLMLEEGRQEAEAMASLQTQHRRLETRKINNLQQQKHRQAIYEAQKARGERSPGGTKLKLKV